MKIKAYLLTILASSIFTACQSELDALKTSSVFNASIEQKTSTRAAINSNNQVVWEIGDEISIFAQNTTNTSYQLIAGAGTSVGTFESVVEHANEGSALDYNFAVYPYSENTFVEDGVVYSTLPLHQIYKYEERLSPTGIMVAKSPSNTLNFKNATGLLRLSIKDLSQESNTLSGIELTSKTHKLSGSCTVDMKKEEPIAIISEEGSNTVLINMSEPISLSNEYQDIYTAIPVGYYPSNDLHVQLIFSDGTTSDSFSLEVEYNIPVYRSAISTLCFVRNGVDIELKYEGQTEDFTDLNQEGDYNAESLWMNGTINWQTGKTYSSTTRTCTSTYLPERADVILIDEGYQIFFYAYQDDNFVGVWDGQDISTISPAKVSKKMEITALKIKYPSYRFKIVLLKSNNGDTSVSDINAIKIFNNSYYNNVYLPYIRSTRPAPILTFIDDDGFDDAMKNWEQIYNLIGIAPTMALITGRIGTGDYASWDTIERLKAKGFHFISHTNSHRNITTLSEAELIADLSISKDIISQHGCDPDFLVYPGNYRSENTDAIVSLYYDLGFCQGEIYNTKPILPMSIHRYSYVTSEMKNVTDLDGTVRRVNTIKSDEQLKKIIDDAADEGGWVVMMSHFHNSDIYYFNDEVKQSIINLCNYATRKGVRILNVREAYTQYMDN